MAAARISHIAKTSMKCGFLACVYLVDFAARERAEHAAAAFPKAE
jgi:hypothetical protein